MPTKNKKKITQSKPTHKSNLLKNKSKKKKKVIKPKLTKKKTRKIKKVKVKSGFGDDKQNS